MIEKNFKHEILKNNLLDNSSNKVSKVVLNSVNSGFSLEISVGIKTNYAFLYIKVNNANALKFYVDDILIANCDGDDCRLIPIVVDRNVQITASGACDKISLCLQGAKFNYAYKDYILPLSNIIVLHNGSGADLLSYQTKDDIVNGTCIDLDSFDNVLSVATCVANGVYQIGMLQNTNGVYYCSSIDNYTNKILIDDIADKATIISFENGDVYIVYIKNGLKYKKLVSGVLSEEFDITINNNRTPIDFAVVEKGAFDIAVFCVKWENGDYGLFVFENDNFIQKLSCNGDNIKICQQDNKISICCIDDYKVKMVNYEITNANESIFFKNMYSESIKNCDNVFFIGDKKIVSNMDNYTVI